VLSFLPDRLKGVLSSVLVIFNTIFWCAPLYIFALLRFLGPPAAEPWCTRQAMSIAELWIDCNNLLLAVFTKIEIKTEGLEGLAHDKWYLIFSNHQTWADIFILQRVFNRRIPLQKFFIKQQLIYVPLIGIAWWALDFPIMKRYTTEFLTKHPELKGKDFEATRRSCEKFKLTPVTVFNFLEGTRFTPVKQQSQQSPYKWLLKPRAGGIAFVLGAMGDSLNALLDITIVYPGHQQPSFWGFLCGRVEKIQVRVQQKTIPEEFLNRNYNEDEIFRSNFQQWVTQLWQEKDELIDELHQNGVESETTVT